MMQCAIEECSRPVRARGWCNMHWRRWRNHGDPLAGRTPNGEAVRFLREVVLRHSVDECLLWPFGRGKHGYATYGKNSLAHRWICEKLYGPPPDPSYQVAHKCGIRACVAPAHLRWATPTENEADKLLHGVQRGRPFGSKDKRPRKRHDQDPPGNSGPNNNAENDPGGRSDPRGGGKKG